MPQELDFSLSASTAKTVRASICKIAFKTIPRCGIAAFILLFMGLYFLFPACQIFQQIQAEKNTPYELTATTDSCNIDLNTLMQIEGVERISPVINMNANLSFEEYALDCEIRAVYSSYLSINFTQGNMYPDSSNMPYLILNRAAAKAFTYEYQTITVTPEDTVMMKANGTERKAIICGIFDDGSDIPVGYMSYDVAQKEDKSNARTELVFLLRNLTVANDMTSALRRQNMYTNFDPSFLQELEVLNTQCRYAAISSICFLLIGSYLVTEKRRDERKWSVGELHGMLISGLTVWDIQNMFVIRLIFTYLSGLVLASAMSCINCTFAWSGVILGSIVVAILILTVYRKDVKKKENDTV